MHEGYSSVRGHADANQVTKILCFIICGENLYYYIIINLFRCLHAKFIHNDCFWNIALSDNCIIEVHKNVDPFY